MCIRDRDTSTSKELVQKLNPKYAVISGEKELGEETKEALSDIPQWKTGELGSIFVDIDEEVTIRSMYANH